MREAGKEAGDSGSWPCSSPSRADHSPQVNHSNDPGGQQAHSENSRVALSARTSTAARQMYLLVNDSWLHSRCRLGRNGDLDQSTNHASDGKCLHELT